MAENRNRQAGFTLLEMLVALVVLGFLMVGLTEGTRFGFRAWKHQADTVAAHDQFDAVDRALRQLLNQATIRRSDARDRLSFTGQLPLAVGLATRRAEMELLVDKEHRLILRWTSLRHEIALKSPGSPADTIMATGLGRLAIDYWRESDASTGAPAGWSDAWIGDNQPRLVKLTLVFANDDARRWPPIVIAPAAIGPGG